jgi:hypothetical protein
MPGPRSCEEQGTVQLYANNSANVTADPSLDSLSACFGAVSSSGPTSDDVRQR